MARVVVTGAAGFLGSHCTRALLSRGHAVLAWTRPGAPLPAAGGGLERLELDLDAVRAPEGRAAAAAALAAFAPDALLHLAWRGTRGAARDDVLQLQNVAVGSEVMSLALAAGARRLVGVGSQAEYGRLDRPISEEDRPAPETLYGAAKLALGQLWLALGGRQGCSCAWARVFSLYGPGEKGQALVPDLIRALHAGRELALGRGEEVWDYLYVEDAAEALALLVERPAEGAFNVSSGIPVRIREVVEEIGRSVAPGAPLAFGARPEVAGAPRHLVGRADRLRDAVDWSPRTPLADGLARTIADLVGHAGRR